jgi:hypothetical protein
VLSVSPPLPSPPRSCSHLHRLPVHTDDVTQVQNS